MPRRQAVVENESYRLVAHSGGENHYVGKRRGPAEELFFRAVRPQLRMRNRILSERPRRNPRAERMYAGRFERGTSRRLQKTSSRGALPRRRRFARAVRSGGERLVPTPHQSFSEDIILREVLSELEENDIPYVLHGPGKADNAHLPEPETESE